MRVLLRRVLLSSVLFPFYGCGIQVMPTGSPGGLLPPDPGAPSASVHVRYEVQCRECTVCYMAEEQTCQGEVKGVWGKSLRIRGTGRGQVWLEATPGDQDGWIQRARIFLDGNLVSEYDGERFPRKGETISISGVP